MWVAFAMQKLLTFFSAKNIRILYIESAKTVNEMTLNELVKLTTLWTTGPRYLHINEPAHDKTNTWHVRTENTQVSLGTRPVWSKSSLYAQWVVKDPSFLHADSENSDKMVGCLGWSASSLGAGAILLVLTCAGSYGPPKVRKPMLSFLYETRRLVLFYIFTKYHKNILKVIWLTERTENQCRITVKYNKER